MAPSCCGQPSEPAEGVLGTENAHRGMHIAREGSSSCGSHAEQSCGGSDERRAKPPVVESKVEPSEPTPALPRREGQSEDKKLLPRQGNELTSDVPAVGLYPPERLLPSDVVPSSSSYVEDGSPNLTWQVMTAAMSSLAGGDVLWPKRNPKAKRAPLQPGRGAMVGPGGHHRPVPHYDDAVTEGIPFISAAPPSIEDGDSEAVVKRFLDGLGAPPPPSARAARRPGPTTDDTINRYVVAPFICHAGQHPAAVRALAGRTFVEIGADVSTSALEFQALDQLFMQAMLAYAYPNGSMAVVDRNGNLAYAKSFTNSSWYSANRFGDLPEAGQPYEFSTPCTMFRWGSVSKTVNTAAVLSAVDSGLLSLSDSVFSRHSPWRSLFVDASTTTQQRVFLRRLEAIKINNLLEHTSGWSSGRAGDGARCMRGTNPKVMDRRLIGALGESAALPMKRAGFATAMMRTDLVDTVGSQLVNQSHPTQRRGQYCYDNFGSALAGYVLGIAHGRAHPWNVWKDRIFDPLGMRHSGLAGTSFEDRLPGEIFYFSTRRVVPDEGSLGDGWDTTAFSHVEPGDVRVLEPYGGDRNIQLFAGAVGLRSNVIDMARFARALVTGSPILSPSSINLMYYGTSGVVPSPSRYGMGLVHRIASSSGALLSVRHTGNIGGAHAGLTVYIRASGLGGACVVYAFNRYKAFYDAKGDLIKYPNFEAAVNTLMTGSTSIKNLLAANTVDLFANYR